MPTESNLPTNAAYPTLDSEPFWDALNDDRLHLPRCTACAYVIWYPRHHCPNCGAGRDQIEWFDASGRGAVYSYTVVRRNRGSWGEILPYIVAYVELDEGPRIMTNIVECDPESVTIGQAVEAVFHSVPEARQREHGATGVLRFRPSA